MRKTLPVISALILIGAAGAQGEEPATTVEIELANFKFTPATIMLDSGRPYLIRFVNRGSGGHNFSAKTFFASSQVADESRTVLRNGGIELKRGEEATLRLVAPTAGRYEVRCTHFLHTGFGMKGEIVVR